MAAVSSIFFLAFVFATGWENLEFDLHLTQFQLNVILFCRAELNSRIKLDKRAVEVRHRKKF